MWGLKRVELVAVGNRGPLCRGAGHDPHRGAGRCSMWQGRGSKTSTWAQHRHQARSRAMGGPGASGPSTHLLANDESGPGARLPGPTRCWATRDRPPGFLGLRSLIHAWDVLVHRWALQQQVFVPPFWSCGPRSRCRQRWFLVSSPWLAAIPFLPVSLHIPVYLERQRRR